MRRVRPVRVAGSHGSGARRRVGLCFLACGLISFGSLHAQQAVLRGRVVNAAGEPVGDQAVSLHRVSAAGGTTVARATSGADGRFELTMTAAPSDALYFAATRYDGGLYIGTPFRLPAPAGSEYVIVVGPGATEAAAILQQALSGGAGTDAAGAGTDAAAGTDAVVDAQDQGTAEWPLALAIASTAAAAALVGWRWTARRRMPARRRLLLELAELEEHLDARAGEVDTAEWDGFQRQRNALRQRLRATAIG